MLLLDAVNLILPKLGEHPVTSLDSQSPTIGVILPEIDGQIAMCLQSGWWFNTFKVDLFPNSEGGLDVPDDTLSFVSLPQYPIIVQRGEQFYNAQTRSYIFPVGQKVSGMLIQNVDFESLPESVAQYVLYSALVVIYITDIGLEQVVQSWTTMAQRAQASMEQEHLRQMQYSIKQSRRYQHLRRAMRG